MKNFLQKIGNSILSKIETSNSQKELEMYFTMGIKFDWFCQDYFNIFLD